MLDPLAPASLRQPLHICAASTQDAPDSALTTEPAMVPGMGRRMGDDDGDGKVTRPENPEIGIATKTRAKPKKPSQYKVLMLNDDYTPMEFVVYVLERFFGKSREDATRIMLLVHQNGVGVCGVFTYEVAETKVAQVVETARRHQHPLQCTMEKD